MGFKSKVIHEEYNLSDYQVDILSSDNIFIETNIAEAMVFRGRQTGIIIVFTIDGNPIYQYTERFSLGITWYLMELNFFYQVSISN